MQKNVRLCSGSIRGGTYQQNKNYNEAIWAYGEAIKLNPQLMLAYNNRGDMYQSINRLMLASDDYDKAIQLGCQIPSSYLFHGTYYESQKKHNLDITDIDKSTESIPWDLSYINTFIASIPSLRESQLFAVYLIKGGIYEQASRKNEAISAYRLASEYIKYNAILLNKTKLDAMKNFLSDKIKNLGG